MICVAANKAGKEKPMKLEELLGAELYQQVKEKIDAANAKETDKLKHIRYADLSEGEYVSKGKHDAALAEKDNLTEQIKTLQGTISELKKNNADNESLQQTISDLSNRLKEQQTANEQVKKTYALKEQMSKQGVLDPDYLIYKAGGLDKFTFDKEGKPVGVEEAVKPYREDQTLAHLFKQDSKPPYQPHGGAEGASANPFAKETFNLTRQGELLRSNPEQAKAMAAAAGVTI